LNWQAPGGLASSEPAKSVSQDYKTIDNISWMTEWGSSERVPERKRNKRLRELEDVVNNPHDCILKSNPSKNLLSSWPKKSKT
jgi:hypothetical protein